MGNIITFEVSEAEHKNPKPNKYLVGDIRMELLEQFLILMFTFERSKLAFTIWLIIFILTLIQAYKIWKGENDDTIQ